MSEPEIYFGVNAIDEVANLYPDSEWHVLRISEVRDDKIEQIRGLLKDKLATETIYQSGMPDIQETQMLQNAFWKTVNSNNAVLLGIGGGSVMDIAKVLRFRPEGSDWLANHLDQPLDASVCLKIPLVLAPTTAGTGSEVTPTATIWDFTKQKKHSFFGSEVFADVAVVDPSLCLGAPWILSRDSAVDALSHALEAIWNRNSNPESTQQAMMAAQQICQYLPLLKENLDDLSLRERLSKAALWAGLAMAKTQTALAHALSYADTVASQKTHGQSCAYWLPYVWQLLENSSCDESIKFSIELAVGKAFSNPTAMYRWLLELGFEVYPPYESDPAIDERVEIVRLSPRGKNFAGFGVND